MAIRRKEAYVNHATFMNYVSGDWVVTNQVKINFWRWLLTAVFYQILVTDSWTEARINLKRAEEESDLEIGNLPKRTTWYVNSSLSLICIIWLQYLIRASAVGWWLIAFRVTMRWNFFMMIIDTLIYRFSLPKRYYDDNDYDCSLWLKVLFISWTEDSPIR